MSHASLPASLPRTRSARPLALTSRAATFDVEIPHHRGDYYDKAAFLLWLPEPAAPVRGVAVVLDGINVDSRHLAGRAGIVLDLDQRQLIPVGVPPKKTVSFWFPDEPTLAVWNEFMTTVK